MNEKFFEIIQELKNNKYRGLLNLNKLMDIKQENILCVIIKYENLMRLLKVFNKLKIPFLLESLKSLKKDLIEIEIIESFIMKAQKLLKVYFLKINIFKYNLAKFRYIIEINFSIMGEGFDPRLQPGKVAVQFNSRK